MFEGWDSAAELARLAPPTPANSLKAPSPTGSMNGRISAFSTPVVTAA